MNFFFGIKNTEFSSEIQIPTFQNRSGEAEDINLYKAYINNDKWKIQEIRNKKINKYFFFIKS